jgi:hypothetical protein
LQLEFSETNILITNKKMTINQDIKEIKAHIEEIKNDFKKHETWEE